MSIIVVPVQTPFGGWSPAWDRLAIGGTEPRGLDARQWAQVNRMIVTDIQVSLDPALVAVGPAVVSGAVSMLDLTTAPNAAAGAEALATFRLIFAGGVEDRVIVVRQPLTAGAPSGQTPVRTVTGPPAIDDSGSRLADDGGGYLLDV